jgi:glycosyltransferase involved in cell wall biosynthesis
VKVLIVTGSFPPMKCGIGDYSFYLANALAADPKIEVAVLTSADAKLGGAGERIRRFSIVNRWSLTEALKIVDVIRNWSPDIVHIQYPTQGYRHGRLPWFLPAIAFFLGKKVVQTWHEGYSRRDAPELLLKSITPSTLVVVRPGYEGNLHPALHWALWNKQCIYIPNASTISRVTLDERGRQKIRARYLKSQKRLVVFFGFVYPHKGAELLFDIADPATDCVVIAGEMGNDRAHSLEIEQRASAEPWRGKVTATGFLSPADSAALLSAADAVVLPFRHGGGEWNTSIHAAVIQGTFVVTTSLNQTGYDQTRNVYYSKVDAVSEMKTALDTYSGTRRKYDADVDSDEWRNIAIRHRSLYETLLSR